MNLWQKLMAAKNALRYGEQLADSATWKHSAIAVSALTGIISTALACFPGFGHVDPAQVEKVSNGIYAAVCLYNVYIHAATTKTVGMPLVCKPRPDCF